VAAKRLSGIRFESWCAAGHGRLLGGGSAQEPYFASSIILIMASSTIFGKPNVEIAGTYRLDSFRIHGTVLVSVWRLVPRNVASTRSI
jgi:hypothetical protein